MPRIARTTKIGHPHLVIAKSVPWSNLFYTDQDYHAYLASLRQMVRDKLVKLHGFCLQGHEVRLVLTPLKLPLAKLIQRLHTSHTLRMNHVLSRQGTLFEGRFRSVLLGPVELAQVVRSVHLWPMRTGFTKRPELYFWSSHAGYIGNSDIFLDMIDMEQVLEQFSPTLAVAQRAFGRFVEAAVLDDDDVGVLESVPGISLEATHLLPEIVEENKNRRRITLASLLKRISLVMGVNGAHLKGLTRRQDIVMARRLFATVAVLDIRRSVTEVAMFLQRDKSQISRLVSQGIDLIDCHEPFRILYESVLERQPISAENSKQLTAT